MELYGDIFAAPGEIIVGGSGQVFKVLKVNPANYRCVDEQGRQWNVPRRTAQRAPEGTTFDEAPRPDVPHLVLGSTVTFTGPSATRFPGTYVLIKHLQDGRAQFAKLGGDGDHYVRASKTSTEKVTV